MSHRRGLNPRPLPYHGNALPTELRWLNVKEYKRKPFFFKKKNPLRG